jgi:hypothetical protein
MALGWLAGPATDSVMGAVPEQTRVAAEDSIGQANAVAAELPASEGARVVAAAADAFTTAMGIGFVVAGACAVLGAVAVRRWLPAHHRDDRAELELVPTAPATPPASAGWSATTSRRAA